MEDETRATGIASTGSSVLLVTPISNQGWVHSSAVPSRFVGISAPQANPIIVPELNGISSPDIVVESGPTSELAPLF